MAERRMFAKAIVESDVFLEMPHCAQTLYFHLSMNADDEGFVNRVQTIMRMVRAGADDLNILVARRFVILFDTKVLVVKHWRINNYLRSDRFHPTEHIEERGMLNVKENGAYTLADAVLQDEIGTQIGGGIPVGTPLVYQRYTELYKNRIEERSSYRASESAHAGATTTTSTTSKNISADNAYTRDVTTTTTPSIEDVRDFAEKNGIVTDLDAFYAYNEMRGWDVKNWRGALKRWAQKDAEKASAQPVSIQPTNNQIPVSTSDSFWRAEAFNTLYTDDRFRALDAKVRRLSLEQAHAEIDGKDSTEIAAERDRAIDERATRAQELGFDPAKLWED